MVTVMEGPWTVSTQAEEPDEGPKDFSYHFSFEPGFVHDPSTGRDLLLDVFTDGDDEQGPQPSAAVPEPTSFVLFIAGWIGVVSVYSPKGLLISATTRVID